MFSTNQENLFFLNDFLWQFLIDQLISFLINKNEHLSSVSKSFEINIVL